MKRVSVMLSIALLLFFSAPLFALGGPELPKDEEIKKNVVEQLVWDDRVDASEIEVEVEFGRVTLIGSVPSDFTRRAAIDDAWSVDGVKSVQDDLTIELFERAKTKEPLASAVKDALLLDAQIHASEITVSAAAGQITLEGTVEALWQKFRAEQIASDVKGVLGVTNEIAVVPAEDVQDEVIAADIVDAIDRNVNVDVDNVDVTVEDGFVTLSGTVKDWTAREAAYDAAANTLGVKGVTDRMLVETGVRPPYTDAEIAQSVRDQLGWDNQVDASDITVKVHDGRVTLSGAVSSYSAKLAAREDALMIKGVVSVENDLVVEPSEPITNEVFLARRVADILEWNPDVDVRNLQVKVIGGVASVEGQVHALWQKKRAEELVNDVQGIIGVINEIAVVPTESILDETIAEDIEAALDRSLQVNVDNVTVEVNNGTVTLSGKVASFTAEQSAFEAALNTAGVRAVINNLEVTG
jgi:hyperosmotically inducible protein